jgi:parallel beta-helix repeat protein
MDDYYHWPKHGLCEFTDPFNRPKHVVILNNRVEGGRSQGIYMDSVYACSVIGNVVVNNDKEGICIDGGCSRSLLSSNVVSHNGHRRRQADLELALDFVLPHGRRENSSSNAQLPGISINNSCYNVVERNIIEQNGGGGVKMVRSSVRNIIAANQIVENNQG